MILMERAKMMAEYLPESTKIPQVCLFILNPVETDQDDFDWTGRLSEIKEAFQKSNHFLQKRLINTMKQHMARSQKGVKQQMRGIGTSLARLNQAALKGEADAKVQRKLLIKMLREGRKAAGEFSPMKERTMRQ